jgi:hypothetical protein
MFFRVIVLALFIVGGLWYLGGEVREAPRSNETQVRGVITDSTKSVKLIKRAELSVHQQEVMARLNREFRHAPELIRVAHCESSSKHIDEKTGAAVRGKKTPADVGVMQINLTYHGERLARLGLDPERFADNIHYALLLYREQGTKPWSASRHCWDRPHKLV